MEKYKDNIDNLKKYYKRIERFDGSKLEIPMVNYKEKIQQLIEKYIQKNSINILSIPRTKEIFERIIERCINKKKPFCGEKGKSDKGFKDVVLWESLIEYAKKHRNDEEYILLTDNYTDFKEDILKKEFKDKTKLEISIFRDTAEMQEKILNNNNIKLYIYTKSDLNSNYLLIEKIKEYFEENEKNIEFNLDKIDDVVCTGKDYYEFSVYIRETTVNKLIDVFWRFEAIITDDKIEIKNATICL